MPFRSVRIAFVVPPLLAFLLGFLGLTQVADDGIIGVSSVATATGESGSATNERIAEVLESVAVENGAMILRVVADRAAPTSRRVALVTNAPSSSGAEWLQGGYPEFSRAMTTRVRPMADLIRYDTAGSYQVIGDAASRRAVSVALAAVGFSVTTESVPLAERFGITGGLSGTGALIGALTLGCVTLCLVGTVGAPRRSAIRRMSGRSTGAVVLAELAELRFSAIAAAMATPVAAVSLWFYNGLASVSHLAAAVVVFAVLLLLPVVVAQTVGTLIACRLPLAAAIRGARPPGALVLAAEFARVPAVLLLVAASFDLVGSVAVARSGDAERDLRAAGDAVHLWITPDAGSDAQSHEYWDRIGAFAGRSLDRGDAFLAASAEVGSGGSAGTLPALIVDAGYLRQQDLRAADGERIAGEGDRISVWIPRGVDVQRDRLVRSLTRWELRGASKLQRREIGGGRLRDEDVYVYPGDSGVESSLSDAIVVVVPNPSAVFSADQLGSWLSTGDVVFTSARVADRAIATSDVHDQFSAVVAVGQDAAERARHAGTAVRVTIAALVAAVVVVVLLSLLATTAHRRRHGRALFARTAAGHSFARVNVGVLVAEAAVLAVGAVSTVNAWWDRHPDGTGRTSVLDPIARSAATGGLVAGGAVIVLAAVGTAVIAWTSLRTERTRGNEA